MSGNLAKQLLSEGLQPLNELGPLLPTFRDGKPPTKGTLKRYITHGIQRPDGQRIFLEGLRAPSGVWCSTRAALARFLEARNQPTATASDDTVIRYPT